MDITIWYKIDKQMIAVPNEPLGSVEDALHGEKLYHTIILASTQKFLIPIVRNPIFQA